MGKNTSGYKNIPFPRAGQAMSATRSLMTQELLCQHWTLETSSKQKGVLRSREYRLYRLTCTEVHQDETPVGGYSFSESVSTPAM
jgi:hypothetical protein